MVLATDSRLQGAGTGSTSGMSILLAIRYSQGFVSANNIGLFRGVFDACQRRDYNGAATVIDLFRASDVVGSACARQFAVSKQHGLAIIGEKSNARVALIPHPAEVETFRASEKVILSELNDLTGNRLARPQQLAVRPAIITGGTVRDPFLAVVLTKFSNQHADIDQIIADMVTYGVGGWLLLGEGDMSM